MLTPFLILFFQNSPPLPFASERVPFAGNPPSLEHQVSTQLDTSSSTKARHGSPCVRDLRPALYALWLVAQSLRAPRGPG